MTTKAESKEYIKASELAENNNWTIKVLKARHDKLLDYVYAFWYDFTRHQDMVEEYRKNWKIEQVDNAKTYPMQLGESLLEDVFLSMLPTTEEQADKLEEKRRKKN